MQPIFAPPASAAMLMNQHISNGIFAEGLASKSSSKTSVTTKVATTFRVSQAVRRENLDSFVAKTRATDPETAAQLQQLFASNDIIDTIAKGISPYGLSVDDVADAFAVYWINSWEASRGIVGSQETHQRAQAVKVQAARGLASSPEFARSTDAQKQEFAEAMLVQAAMISAHMEAAAGDPSQLRAVAKAVSQGAAASGLDLDKMTLTEDGFVPAKPRKKADASDAAGDDATALASADTGGTSGDSSTPNYALIAGAAGAGLGAAFLIGKAMGKKG